MSNFVTYGLLNPRPAKQGKKFPPSQVVPDRNMSISVIMKKYAGGQHRGLQPQYTDPEMMDHVQGIDARKLSMCELHERINENKNKIRDIQFKLQQQERQKQIAEAQRLQEKYRSDLELEIRNKLAKETTLKH